MKESLNIVSAFPTCYMLHDKEACFESLHEEVSEILFGFPFPRSINIFLVQNFLLNSQIFECG